MARIAGNEILTTLSHYKIKSVVISSFSKESQVVEFVEGMVLGNYQFLKYFKDKKEKTNCLKEIRLESGLIESKALNQLRAVLEATCNARDLVNEPQSYLSARRLANEIVGFGKKYGFKVEVFDKKKIERLKMGGVLAVNRGSIAPPTFSVLEWKPAKYRNKKPIVLVGKGIVYDTGGLSLKPTANSMDMMKSDMAGAATVVGSVIAAAKAKLPLHLIALVPSTDNRPGNDAYAPGDVITMFSGDTVEVLNTDAEGRLVLADALHYAKRYEPVLVLDFATLTGSAVRAVGPEAICYMGNANETVKTKMEESGFSVFERLIQFPLWKEYGDQLKSNIADLKNLGGSTAGMITAGKFLEYFTDYNWLHFDIAGSAYLKNADAYRPKEGTGVGVRLVFDFLKHY
ncbi:MAG: leucyl aminopeptidase [Bacteroidota bacterium]